MTLALGTIMIISYFIYVILLICIYEIFEKKNGLDTERGRNDATNDLYPYVGFRKQYKRNLSWPIILFIIMCIFSVILMNIPVSDTNTDIKLYDTKEIYKFDDKPSIDKNIEKGYDISKRIPYQVITYSYYHKDSNNFLNLCQIDGSRAEIYCIDYNETQKVETYICNEGRITAFSFPGRAVSKIYISYKIYLHEDQLHLVSI